MVLPTTPPPLDFDHNKGDEIPTKHKEAIRQLHWFAKIPVTQLETRYKLGQSTIRRILKYDRSSRHCTDAADSRLHWPKWKQWYRKNGLDSTGLD